MALNRHVISGLAIVAVTATAVFAGSHGGGNPAVKARKAHMGLNGHNIAVLGSMAKGDTEYDAGAAQAAADNLVALATMNQMSYWPPGTSHEDLPGDSFALPAIWADGSDIGAKVGALVDATMAMQAAAGSLEGVQGAMGAVGGACGACHKAYRLPFN